MVKTTVYLPETTKKSLSRLAESQRLSEAELIRTAIERMLESEQPPRPTLPLFASGQSDLAERFDEYLEGFGE
jgi:hypothetical protein